MHGRYLYRPWGSNVCVRLCPRMCACDDLLQVIFLLVIWKFEIMGTLRHLLIPTPGEIVYL